MIPNNEGYNALTPLSVFGGGEGAQTRAAVPTSQLGGGFSFTPGGVTINGNQVQSNGGLQFDLPLSSVNAITQQALAFSANNSNLNRGFVGGVISTGQANLNTTQNNVLNFGRDVMKTSQEITGQAIASNERMNSVAYSAMQKTAQYMHGTTMFTNAVNTLGSVTQRMGQTPSVVGSNQAGGSGGGGFCFITTAICEREGLADDCEILTAFREFRDTFMQQTESDKETVREYYRIAPGILSKIRARKDGGESLEMLRVHFLLPAFNAIKANDFERARTLYIAMVVVAKTITQ